MLIINIKWLKIICPALLVKFWYCKYFFLKNNNENHLFGLHVHFTKKKFKNSFNFVVYSYGLGYNHDLKSKSIKRYLKSIHIKNEEIDY